MGLEIESVEAAHTVVRRINIEEGCRAVIFPNGLLVWQALNLDDLQSLVGVLYKRRKPGTCKARSLDNVNGIVLMDHSSAETELL